MIKSFVISILLSTCATNSFAQVEKIDTDRPDQTESAVLVPKKWVQLEMGFSVQTTNSLENELVTKKE